MPGIGQVIYEILNIEKTHICLCILFIAFAPIMREDSLKNV